jgi:hypothetical protein
MIGEKTFKSGCFGSLKNPLCFTCGLRSECIVEVKLRRLGVQRTRIRKGGGVQ